MDPDQVTGLLGQGGIAAALIFVIYKVGMALVDQIKGMRDDLAEHTKTDVAHHTDVREAILRVEARLDTALDLTPIREQRAYKTPPRGVYQVKPRKDD